MAHDEPGVAISSGQQSSHATRIALQAGFALVLLGLVGVNYYIFTSMLQGNYFRFWIDQGSLVAIAMMVISLVWDNLDKEQPDLIASSPARYVRSCFVILAGVFVAFRNSIPNATPHGSERVRSVSVAQRVANVFDSVVALAFYAVLTVVCLLWLLTIAPILYFTTIVTGAPARASQLSGGPQSSLVTTAPGGISSTLTPLLGRKPVTTTAAMTALVLWLMDLAMSGWSLA